MAIGTFPVYKVKYSISPSMQDPHMPPDRMHNAIFVQTRANAGTLYHVTGDITSRGGMVYQSKDVDSPGPQNSRHFVSKELLGHTRAGYHPQLWKTVLQSLPTPPQQKAPNPNKGGEIEPFKEMSGSHYIFYKDGEERKPLWKCTEWIDWHAIPCLQKNHLIQHK